MTTLRSWAEISNASKQEIDRPTHLPWLHAQYQRPASPTRFKCHDFLASRKGIVQMLVVHTGQDHYVAYGIVLVEATGGVCHQGNLSIPFALDPVLPLPIDENSDAK